MIELLNRYKTYLSRNVDYLLIRYIICYLLVKSRTIFIYYLWVHINAIFYRDIFLATIQYMNLFEFSVLLLFRFTNCIVARRLLLA